jgi:hypothetical protein
VLLTHAGLGVAPSSIASLLAAVVLPLLGDVPRIRVEEDALVNGLGDRCARCAAGRPRLLPYIASGVTRGPPIGRIAHGFRGPGSTGP